MSNYNKLPGQPISRAKMNVLKDTAILSMKDFNQIKLDSQYTPVLSSQLNLQNSSVLDSDGIKNQRALALKQKLIDYDKKNPRASLLEFEGEEAKKILAEQNKVSKDDDAVKIMDKMVLYAKIATIRDRQLDERKVMEDIYKQKENRLEVMMELERLKEIQFLQDREKELKRQRMQGAKIVIEQIKESDHERMKKREQQERERIQMLKAMEKLAEEDKRRQEDLRLRQKNQINEAVAANKIAQLAKQKKILEEKEEDLKILIFQREKDKQEEAILAEKKRIAAEKEVELQKLREKQKRSSDKQGELDAIRAKRAFEENERKERQKEEEKKLEQQRIMEMLVMENKKQKEAKEKILAEEAKKEKEEFNKRIMEQMKEMEKEKEIALKKKEDNLKNQEAILQQIAQKEELGKNSYQEKMEEGRKIKEKLDEYKKNLEAIRRQKIAELKSLNIKDKYIVPLEMYNFKTSAFD
jgi:hypothetical protein